MFIYKILYLKKTLPLSGRLAAHQPFIPFHPHQPQPQAANLGKFWALRGRLSLREARIPVTDIMQHLLVCLRVHWQEEQQEPSNSALLTRWPNMSRQFFWDLQRTLKVCKGQESGNSLPLETSGVLRPGAFQTKQVLVLRKQLCATKMFKIASLASTLLHEDSIIISVSDCDKGKCLQGWLTIPRIKKIIYGSELLPHMSQRNVKSLC